MQQHVAEGRDEVADGEERDADAERPTPAPGGREFDEVVGQHEVSGEARDVVEGAEFVPVADAVEAHVAVVSGVSRQRREEFDVGQQQRDAPDAEQDAQVIPVIS